MRKGLEDKDEEEEDIMLMMMMRKKDIKVQMRKTR